MFYSREEALIAGELLANHLSICKRRHVLARKLQSISGFGM